jgi:hypothetical protein
MEMAGRLEERGLEEEEEDGGEEGEEGEGEGSSSPPRATDPAPAPFAAAERRALTTSRATEASRREGTFCLTTCFAFPFLFFKASTRKKIVKKRKKTKSRSIFLVC